jgi:hypothetical protein
MKSEIEMWDKTLPTFEKLIGNPVIPEVEE